MTKLAIGLVCMALVAAGAWVANDPPGDAGALLGESDRSGLVQRAASWFEQGEYGKAGSDLMLALHESPNSTEVRGAIGLVLEAQGLTAEAEAFYKKVYEYDYNAVTNYARMLYQQGRFSESVEVASVCLEKHPAMSDPCRQIMLAIAARTRGGD